MKISPQSKALGTFTNDRRRPGPGMGYSAYMATYIHTSIRAAIIIHHPQSRTRDVV